MKSCRVIPTEKASLFATKRIRLPRLVCPHILRSMRRLEPWVGILPSMIHGSLANALPRH